MRQAIITYTFPRPVEAEEIEAQINMAQALGLSHEDVEKARRELAALSEPRAIRITIGQASVLDYTRYQRMRTEAIERFRQMTGKLPDDPEAQEVSDEAWSLLGVGLHRAYMLAVLRKVERLEAGQWQECELDEEWTTIDGMARAMPVALFERWSDAARKLNEGLFWTDESERGKASGGGSVSVRTI